MAAPAAAQGPVVRDLARELACSPEAVVLPPAPTLHVIGGEQQGRQLFGTGDAVIVSGGSAQGIRVGQEYAVRRVVKDTFALPLSGFVPISIKTAGHVRIIDVEKDVAIGTIADACDGVLMGDYLEPFTRPADPAPIAAGQPDYANAGVIILGDERRQIGAAGALMVLDRGSAHGVRAGQRLTIFRDTMTGGPVLRVGEATAVIVRTDTSVLRIEKSRDAVFVGDRVALAK
jgi:hypothetical protein